MSASDGGQQSGAQGGAEERPASLINFKLDQVLPDPERRCEATWQLKRPIQDLPAKLTQLFKLRQWVPSKETRRLRMDDAGPHPAGDGTAEAGHRQGWAHCAG